MKWTLKPSSVARNALAMTRCVLPGSLGEQNQVLAPPDERHARQLVDELFEGPCVRLEVELFQGLDPGGKVASLTNF